MFLFLKFAPRAFCANIILFASSKRIGMNLRAMDIVRDISWGFIFKYFSGDKTLSSANAKFCEEVVNITTALAVTIINKRRKIITLFLIIIGFIEKCPVDKKDVSNSKNKFKHEVNIAITSILLMPRKYLIKEISDLYAKIIV